MWPDPVPALLHGDAQQNNFVSTADGAVVIDAAPYFGHPKADLALVDCYSPGVGEATSRVSDRSPRWMVSVAVILFATLLPFGLESVILPGQWWWVVLLSVAISGVFIVLERVGAVIDTPFENQITDVALTSITTDIERDLREQLAEPELPDPEPVVNGYLW